MHETAARAISPDAPTTPERFDRVRAGIERLSDQLERLTEQLAPVLREPEPGSALSGIEHPGDSYLTRWLAETAQAIDGLCERVNAVHARVDL